jgi:hypothetical protein
MERSSDPEPVIGSVDTPRYWLLGYLYGDGYPRNIAEYDNTPAESRRKVYPQIVGVVRSGTLLTFERLTERDTFEDNYYYPYALIRTGPFTGSRVSLHRICNLDFSYGYPEPTLDPNWIAVQQTSSSQE